MNVSRKIVGKIVNNTRHLSVSEAGQFATLFELDADSWIDIQAADK